MRYLKRTMPSITGSFEKLRELGILNITDETIEIIIPEDMKKYTSGYNLDKISATTDVKKTIPVESEDDNEVCKEILTTEVKKTLPTDKENFTSDVKKTLKKPLVTIDNEDVTDAIILNNNTRVLPVPAKSGNTEQTHSNGNTTDNIGLKRDLECDVLQSQASPSVLAPSQHTPKKKDEKEGEETSLPINDYSDILPIADNQSKTLSSNHSQTESEVYTSNIEGNDLQLVMENLDYFNVLYENAKWHEIDISNFSNADISRLVIEKENKNVDKSISSKTYYFFQMLIKYSSLMGSKSNLWKEFQKQCYSKNRVDLISQHTHSHLGIRLDDYDTCSEID